MRLTFLPKTTSGKWSIGISIVFIILIWTKIQYSIPVPTFAIAALGMAGFIVSIIAIIKNKDRSILNLIPILVGLLIIMWAAAELIFLH
jgi:xanthine/uracil permease